MHRFVQRRFASNFATGFAPPKGSRETPKIVTKRRNPSTSLPSHLGNPDKSVPNAQSLSPKQQYREQLRQTRHRYAQELLGKHGQREAAAATKRAENEAHMQQEKQALALERQQAQQHEAEITKLLDLQTGNVHSKEAIAARKEERQMLRQQNRQSHDAHLAAMRRKHLLKLYRSSESFVTLENLDAKIDELLTMPPFRYNYISNLEEFMQTRSSSASEIERRKEVLKEAMGL